MKLKYSEDYLKLDNRQLVSKLESGKTVVYEHLARERVFMLKEETKLIEEALNNEKR